MRDQMAYKFTTIGHRTSVNNEQITIQITIKVPQMTKLNEKQFKHEN